MSDLSRTKMLARLVRSEIDEEDGGSLYGRIEDAVALTMRARAEMYQTELEEEYAGIEDLMLDEAWDAETGNYLSVVEEHDCSCDPLGYGRCQCEVCVDRLALAGQMLEKWRTSDRPRTALNDVAKDLARIIEREADHLPPLVMKRLADALCELDAADKALFSAAYVESRT